MGFFSPTVWTAQKQPLDLVANCNACKLHERCNSPFMPVSGVGRKKVLVIAEAPGETEDDRNAQLVGNAGMEAVRIFSQLGYNMRKDCWLTNALICRPWQYEGRKKANRDPTKAEINHCRPNLSKTLKSLQPDVIIPMGRWAIEAIMPFIWKENEVDEVARWTGWQMPSTKLNAWVCPTYHPSSLLHKQGEDRVTNWQAADLHVTNHIRKAMKIEGKPWPDGAPNWESYVDIEFSPSKAAAKIRAMTEAGRMTAFDFETTTLKPWGPHAEILCCSMSNGETTIAYPWLGEAVRATREFVQSDLPKVVANLRMEQNWCREKLRTEVKNWTNDITGDAHVLNCHGGVSSLKFQALVRLGVDDYDSYLDPFKRPKDGNSNSPNRLKEADKKMLLLYCGLDSLFEWLVAEDQNKERGI